MAGSRTQRLSLGAFVITALGVGAANVTTHLSRTLWGPAPNQEFWLGLAAFGAVVVPLGAALVVGVRARPRG